MDYVDLVFEDFIELHGDRAIGDDRAIAPASLAWAISASCSSATERADTRERNDCFFGCAHPEGYRKALRVMNMAAKFRLPVIC